MSDNLTLYDIIVNKIKNNKYIVYFMLFFAIISAAPQFFDGCTRFFTVFKNDKKSVSINIGLINPKMPSMLNDKHEFTKFDSVLQFPNYEFHSDNYFYYIENANGYYKNIVENGEISDAVDFFEIKDSSGDGSSENIFFVDFPKIDFKIVNNTFNTVFFNKAEIKIDEILIDSMPIPIFTYLDSNPGEKQNGDFVNFYLYNIGLGTMEDVKFEFDIISDKTKSMKPSSFEFDYFIKEMPYTEAWQAHSIGIDHMLLSKGVDAKFFNRNEELLKIERDSKSDFIKNIEEKYSTKLGFLKGTHESKIYKDFTYDLFYEMKIKGKLSYRWKNNKYSIDFITTTYLINAVEGLGDGGGVPISSTYDILIDTKNRNKIIELPISQFCSSGGVDRFALKIAADKSCTCVLNVTLHYNDNEYIKLKPMKLKLWNPNFSN